MPKNEATRTGGGNATTGCFPCSVFPWMPSCAHVESVQISMFSTYCGTHLASNRSFRGGELNESVALVAGVFSEERRGTRAGSAPSTFR